MENQLKPVSQDKFEKIVKEFGIVWKEQSAFNRIDVGPFRIYVPRTKMVSRIDLSGVEFNHDGWVRIPPEFAKQNRMGRVRAQLDFENPEDKVLAAFRDCIQFLIEKAKDEDKVEAASMAQAPTGATGGGRSRRSLVKERLREFNAKRSSEKQAEEAAPVAIPKETSQPNR